MVCVGGLFFLCRPSNTGCPWNRYQVHTQGHTLRVNSHKARLRNLGCADVDGSNRERQ